VSYKSKRGRHTTRSAILLDMPDGGLLLDTPGFNYPAMDQVTSGTVAGLFPEIQQQLSEHSCQFSDCTHTHEPGCCVRGTFERYEHYVRCARPLP
jgi:ribosome biogenesis GTPase / thiamine phosphate phosphatase